MLGEKISPATDISMSVFTIFSCRGTLLVTLHAGGAVVGSMGALCSMGALLGALLTSADNDALSADRISGVLWRELLLSTELERLVDLEDGSDSLSEEEDLDLDFPIGGFSGGPAGGFFFIFFPDDLIPPRASGGLVSSRIFI